MTSDVAAASLLSSHDVLVGVCHHSFVGRHVINPIRVKRTRICSFMFAIVRGSAFTVVSSCTALYHVIRSQNANECLVSAKHEAEIAKCMN